MDSDILNDQAVVELEPLHINDQGDEGGEVGRADTGVFVSLPPEGIAVIRWLQTGLPLHAVKERFAAAYGQEPDLQDLVQGLAQCGFVRRIDGRPWPGSGEPQDARASIPGPRGWRLFGDLSQARVAWLLSRPMLLAYTAIWLAAPVALALRPDLIPSAADAWIHPRVMVNMLTITVIAWVLLFAHELAHLLAARAVGCSGALSLSHRLTYLVAQTDLSGLRALPRRLRYGPLLAGMTWDLAILLVCLLLQAAGVRSPLPGLVAYLLTVLVLFQFAFFMRTDMYYVIATALRLGNLLQDTQAWIRNVMRRLLAQPERHDLGAVPERELRIIRWYTIVYVLGVSVTIGQFLVLELPLLLRFLVESVHGIQSGPATAAFWDGAIWLALTTFYFGLLGTVAWRERQAARATAAA